MPTPDSYRQCKVCFSPHEARINDLIAQGIGMLSIERQMKAEGYVIKDKSLATHLARCLRGNRNLKPSTTRKAAEKRLIESMTPQQRTDFAILTRDKAIEELHAGRIRVSTKDGLMAQALIDRRVEKVAESTYRENLLRLLTGGGRAGPVALTEGSIEGEFIDVTPEEENPALAPAELRG